MDRQEDSHHSSSGDVEVYAQVQSLFTAAVELPMSERIPWVTGQAEVDPPIVKQVVAALKADAVCGGDQVESVDDDPALAVTVDSGLIETQQHRARVLPQIPNYEIIEEIDRGGTGIVYRARQLRPERIVAIKMMKMGAFSSAREIQRFLNEANAASQMDHAAVVPIYEAGEFQGEPFISIEVHRWRDAVAGA